MAKLAELSRELSGLSQDQIANLLVGTMEPRQRERLLARAAQAREADSRLTSEIAESLDRAKEAKTLDAVFVIDCTGSMEERIAHAKETVASIQEAIVQFLGTGGSVRLAVVGFRDYADTKKLEVLPFTEDVQEVEGFLSTLRAEGGGDACEDVIGGIEAALALCWSARTRLMYLLCDAPSHGARFHASPDRKNYDAHLNDPKQWQPTDELMAKSVALRINLVCLQYLEGCSKMLGIFKELREAEQASGESPLQSIVLKPDNTAEDFVRCILESTSETLRSSLSRSRASAPSKPEELQQLTENQEVCWEIYKSWPCHQVLVTAVTVLGLNSEPKRNTTVQRFYVRAEPFASGNMRWAFPAVSEDGLFFVLKVHRADRKKARDLTSQDVQTQAYAKIFAAEFSRLVPDTPLQFVDSWIVQLRNWEVAEHATIELFIPGKYEKYTSNNGYVSPGALLAETFSHFTWQHSGGSMQVTDLQGVNCSILTDPQIHCTREDFFSRGNLGKRGMDSFFMGHCCNSLCRKLGLKQSPMQSGFDHISDLSTGADDSDVESVISSYSTSGRFLSCELCMSHVLVGTKHHAETLDQHKAVWCEECKLKVEDSLVEAKCLSCKQPFSYSFHVIKFKGCAVPATCEDCEHGETWMWV